MIAADSSSLVAFLDSDTGRDVEAVALALRQRRLVLPPVVVTEFTSEPEVAAQTLSLLAGLPLLPVTDGYWERAGRTRAGVLARGLKARLPDALVCQSCLDHDVALITRDADFRHFAKHCGLKLA